MNTQLNVHDVEKLQNTISTTNHYNDEVAEAVERRLRQLHKLLEECNKEKAHSEELLDKAIDRERKARDAEKRARQIEIATRGTKAHPAAYAWWVKCKMELTAAIKHLADMRRRYAMALEAQARASELFANVQEDFRNTKERIRNTSDRSNRTVQEAYDTLHRYFAVTNPEIREAHKKWEQEECVEGKPVTPVDLSRRLNPGESVMFGLLAALYASDAKFRAYVDERRQEFLNGTLTREQIETKIKKNLVGRLAEEIVIRAFKPYAESVDTQAVKQVDDEHYTKTDLIARNLKVPIILGKGTGMGAPKGGSIGVEVKAGQPEYLLSQREHLLFQANGHSGCNASCTICTRDLHDLASEQTLRSDVRQGGSPLLAMLPYKKELDAVAIDFVLGKGNNANV